MTDSRVQSLDDDEQIDQAVLNGAALSELMGLFAYFLHHTPEGRQARRDLEKDWVQTCQILREQNLVKGPQFTCGQWFRHLRRDLLLDGKKSSLKKSPPPDRKSEKKQTLRFKNIKK